MNAAVSSDVGLKIGRYRVLKTLATALTTEVYHAVDQKQNREVALKVLRGEHVSNSEHRANLQHEYDVAQKVKHARVISVYEVNVDHQPPYLAMEWFDAPNMKHWVQQGVDRYAYYVTMIIGQAAEAVGCFNDRGWVHRDIKPDNFLVSTNADVKLIDFALAQKKRGTLGKLLAGKSKVQGTRSYMSPEQIRGEPADQRADVYSFGCTIFELVTGRPPYAGANTDELLNKHLKAPIPQPHTTNSEVTREFSDLVRRTMAKQPQDRPATMADFLAEFHTMTVFRQTPAKQPLVLDEKT